MGAGNSCLAPVALVMTVVAANVTKRQYTIGMKPLSIAPSQHFEGSDGSWSSFTLSVGGPNNPRTIRVFPSTSIGMIWTVPDKGCTAGWLGGRDKCFEDRGGLSNSSLSSTWTESSVYKTNNMAIMSAYGHNNVNLNIGWDDVLLGLPQSGAKSLKQVLIGEMEGEIYSTFGLLGLDPKPTNFTEKGGFNAPQTSMLQRLKADGIIPSLSFGYTAGEKSSKAEVFGSLVLGGYDLSRFDEKSGYSAFPFDDDVETPLKLSLHAMDFMIFNPPGESDKAQWPLATPASKAFRDNTHDSIKALAPQAENSLSLQDFPVQVHIDSSRPFIYLPRSVCTRVSEILGLSYDTTNQWMLVPQPKLKALQNSLDEFRFTFDSPQSSESTTKITIPVASLIQPLQYPYVQNKTYYIPLRPSDNTDQYVLGRSFLQRAYIKINFESRTFGLYPSSQGSGGRQQQLVAITSQENGIQPVARTDQPNDGVKLSSAVIAGISIGVAGIATALLIAYCVFHRHQKRKANEATRTAQVDQKGLEIAASTSSSSMISAESVSDAKELDSTTIYESSNRPRCPQVIPNNQESQELAKPVVGELESSAAAFGGLYKEIRGLEGDKSIIKVYYEMEASPSNGATSSTLSDSSILEDGSGPGVNDAWSPVPQTPAEYYDRYSARNQSSSHVGPQKRDFTSRMAAIQTTVSQVNTSRTGARSSIIQTPHEYYGTSSLNGVLNRRGWIGNMPNMASVAQGNVEYVEDIEEVDTQSFGLGLRSNISHREIAPKSAVAKSDTSLSGSDGNTSMPRVTFTPATPLSPTQEQIERSRWLRGYSGRRRAERKEGEEDRQEYKKR